MHVHVPQSYFGTRHMNMYVLIGEYIMPKCVRALIPYACQQPTYISFMFLGNGFIKW